MAGCRMLRIGCAGDADESVLRLFATSIYDVSFHDAHREPAEDLAEALRRAQVFSAWGWRAVRFPYHQPPLAGGGGWASDLLLLHHGDAVCVSGSSIDALNAGLRESLGAGEPPAYLTHRFSAGPGRPAAVGPLAIVDVIV